MNKFDKLYNKIISECKHPVFNEQPNKEYMFAPKTPFKITEDMLVGDGFVFKDLGSWAGKVKEIISDNEMIYEVCGKYFENCKFGNFHTIRCKPFLIRYKLTPGELYFICDKEDPHCEWDESIFEQLDLESDIETEEGECCGGAAGITTNSVFGTGNTAGDSVIQDSPEHSEHSGITTHDMKAMYTLHLNPRYSKKYPIFRRKRTK